MAIPVLFSAELFPWNDLKVDMLEESIKSLNAELRAFFSDKVDLGGSVPDGKDNLTEVDTVYGTDSDKVATVQATVVIGFKGLDDLSEAQKLADSFSSTRFKYVKAEVVDPAKVLAPPVS